ncbi:MAG: xanthine dehydrogenase family protein subunit M [Ideonella sp.]
MYSFEYLRPTDRAEALNALSGDARYLAGGQSLVQAMKLRLSASERLVDLGGVDDLRGMRVDRQSVTIGAMCRHAEVARSTEVRGAIAALAELAEGIGDPMVRTMGTLGGSIANADPAACYPAALLALDATVQTDRRTISAEDFFTGVYETALQPGELITAVEFPIPQRAAYVKFKQPASRFAMVGVFVCQRAGAVRVAVTGVKSQVFRAIAIEAALQNDFVPQAAFDVVIGSDDITDDIHAPATYKAAMISVMAGRAVAAALAR